MSLFKKKKIESPPDPDTYGEGLLIVACKKFQLTLIKEHFSDEFRYIVKDGDIRIHKGQWWDSSWTLYSANAALSDIYAWAKQNRIGITEEVLVS
jgi:hypothetical protein